jgi:hypothetical protein
MIVTIVVPPTVAEDRDRSTYRKTQLLAMVGVLDILATIGNIVESRRVRSSHGVRVGTRPHRLHSVTVFFSRASDSVHGSVLGVDFLAGFGWAFDKVTHEVGGGSRFKFLLLDLNLIGLLELDFLIFVGILQLEEAEIAVGIGH